MSIKHGNKILRNNQSELKEQLRWERIKTKEADEKAERFVGLLKEENAKVVRRNMQISGLKSTIRKLQALMNTALEETVFDFALEYTVTNHHAAVLTDLKAKFEAAIKEEL